jgi:hypothetical protein
MTTPTEVPTKNDLGGRGEEEGRVQEDRGNKKRATESGPGGGGETRKLTC